MTTKKEPVLGVPKMRGIRTYKIVEDEKTGLMHEVETGYLSMSDENNNNVPVVNPNGKPVINQTLVIIGTILGAVAVTLPSLPVSWPAWVPAVCSAILGILSVLGIASPGIRKQDQGPK
jgi:hypothetical protein